MSVGHPNVIAALAAIMEAEDIPPAEPFLSIKPFRLADAGILAARDDEIDEMVRLLVMYRGVILYGESGSGKTSLVNAGVIPRMLEFGFWPHRVRVSPGTAGFALEPIQYSDDGPEAVLPSAFGGGGGGGRIEFAPDEFVGAVITATEQARILLVFDQFEEFVTLSPDATQVSDAQEAMIEALLVLLRGGADASNGSSGPIRVKLLFTFREDYLASLAPLLERYPDLVHQGLRLVPPPLECATDIIRAPFERYKGHYSPELSLPLAMRIAEMLARHSRGNELPLSMLQIVCSRLVHEKDPAAVLEKEQIPGLVADYTKAALAELPDNLRAAAVEILGRLITASGTRNVVARNDLVQRPGSDTADPDPDLAAALTILEQGYLIRKENRRGVDLYELASEFLIEWIRELKAERKAEAARIEAEQRAEIAQREQERKLRRLWFGLGAAAVVLVAMIVLVVIALHQKSHAQHEQGLAMHNAQVAKREAEVATAEALASRAQQLLGIRPDGALIMALAAYRGDPSSPQVQANTIAALEQAKLSGASGVLHGSGSTVSSVAFDPASGVLASGGADGTIRLWSTRSNTEVGRLEPSPPVGIGSVAFGEHGRALVSGDSDGYIRLWDVSSRKELGAPLRVLNQLVVSVAFSPSDGQIAVAGLDGPVRLVAVTGGRRLGAVSDPPGSGSIDARAVAFSPDSRTLASVGNDWMVRFWNLSTGAAPSVVKVRSPLFTISFNPRQPDELAVAGLKGVIYLLHVGSAPFAQLNTGTSAVNTLAFNPDGRELAAGLADDSVQLWSVKDRTQLGAPLIGPVGPVTSVAFSPAGDMLAAGSTDTTIRLWPIPVQNLQYGQPLAPKLGSVYSVAFGGSHEFAAASKGGLRVWKVANGTLTGGPTVLTSKRVETVAFQPGGTGALAAGLYNGVVAGWNQPRGVSAPTAQGKTVYALAYSPNGRMLAYAGADKRITVMDLASGHRVRFPAPTQVYSLAFGPNADILASSSDDRTIHLWKISDAGGHPSGGLLAQLSGDSDAVFSLAFNHAGVLASGSDDGTIRLWDVRARKEIGEPMLGDRGYVQSVAFNRDGDILASAGYDGTVRLWDVASQSQIGVPFSASASPLDAIAFSPDGKELIAGSIDGNLTEWPVVRMPHAFGELQNMVCRTVGTNLSKVEWGELAPAGVSEQKPCP